MPRESFKNNVLRIMYHYQIREDSQNCASNFILDPGSAGSVKVIVVSQNMLWIIERWIKNTKRWFVF